MRYELRCREVKSSKIRELILSYTKCAKLFSTLKNIHSIFIYHLSLLRVYIHRTIPRLPDPGLYTIEAVKAVFSFDFDSFLNKKGT